MVEGQWPDESLELAKNLGLAPRDVIREHGEQLIAETGRTLKALTEAVAHGQIDIEDEGMRHVVMKRIDDLTQLLQSAYKQQERNVHPEAPVSAAESPDKLAQFNAYTEHLKIRVEEKSEEYNQQEQWYLDGDITEQEYRAISEQRAKYFADVNEEFLEHTVGVDMTDAILDTFQYVNELGRTARTISPGERLDVLWTHLERDLLVLSSAYEHDLESYWDGKLSEDDIRSAWEEKAIVYERFVKKISAKRGLVPAEILELELRARGVLRPKERMPLKEPETEEVTRPQKSELMLSLEEYNARITELLEEVSGTQTVADAMQAANNLGEAARRKFLEELQKIPEKIYQLDEKTAVSVVESSVERAALIKDMTKLRNQLLHNTPPEKPGPGVPQSDADNVIMNAFTIGGEVIRPASKPTPKRTSFRAARDVYLRVKATYASVQHTLNIDDRRELRTQISRLAGLVRRAEAQSVQFEVVRRGIAHATEHAPLIAHAALSTVRPAIRP